MTDILTSYRAAVLRASHHPYRVHALDLGRDELQSCWGREFSHFYRSAHLVARRQDRFARREMVSRRTTSDQANEALDAVARREVVKALIVPHD